MFARAATLMLFAVLATGPIGAAQPVASTRPATGLPPGPDTQPVTGTQPDANAALPVPPVPPRIADGHDYDSCLAMLFDDPQGALTFADNWTSGGDGATHCRALAQIESATLTPAPNCWSGSRTPPGHPTSRGPRSTARRCRPG